MTKHIMTNGIAINGTIGTVATTAVTMSTVVAAHEVRLDVRSNCEHRCEPHDADASCDLANEALLGDSGKWLSKPLPAKQCSKAMRQQGGAFRNAGYLPAPAWASFVMSRNESYGSVSI